MQGPERRGALRPVIAYFLLAWLLSWMWLIPLALGGRVVDPGGGWPTHFPALLGPALAALIVSAAAGGRAAVARLGRAVCLVRVPARWWLVALSPLLVGAGTLAVAAL